MTANPDSIGIIVLAAGASRRMKEPKQLKKFEGKTLLHRAVETAIESIYNPVIVILGANFEFTKAEIKDLPVEIVFNQNWQSGLSSSIKVGLEKILEIAPDISAALITLADQPLVTAHQLNNFAAEFKRGNTSIVAAKYKETTGVPALFARETFADFDELSGDKGAKAIIAQHRQNLATMDLPEAAFDIDTQEDFAKLNRSFFQ